MPENKKRVGDMYDMLMKTSISQNINKNYNSKEEFVSNYSTRDNLDKLYTMLSKTSIGENLNANYESKDDFISTYLPVKKKDTSGKSSGVSAQPSSQQESTQEASGLKQGGNLRIPTDEEGRMESGGVAQREFELTQGQKNISNVISTVSPLQGVFADEAAKNASEIIESEKVADKTEEISNSFNYTSLEEESKSDRMIRAKAAYEGGVMSDEDYAKVLEEVQETDPSFRSPDWAKYAGLSNKSKKQYSLYKSASSMLSASKDLVSAVKEDKGVISGTGKGIADYFKGYRNLADFVAEVAPDDSENLGKEAVTELQQKVQRYNDPTISNELTDDEMRYVSLASSTGFTDALYDKYQKQQELIKNKEFKKAEAIDYSEDEEFFLEANDKKIYESINAKNEKAREGIEFTDAEKKFLEASQNYTDVLTLYQDKVPMSYEVGQAIGQSVGFLGEFALTGGLFKVGAKFGSVIANSIKNQAAKKISVQSVKNNTLRRLVKNASKYGTAGIEKVSGAAVQTAGIPTFINGTVNDVVENDKDIGEALTENYAKTFSEVLIERAFVGSGTSKGAGATSRFNSQLDRYFGAVGSALKGVKSPVQFSKALAGEFVEEQLSNLSNYVIEGDDWKSITDKMFDPRTQAVTFWSVAAMMGAGGGLKLVSDGAGYLNMRKAEKQLDITADQIDAIMKGSNNAYASGRLSRYGRLIDKSIKEEVDKIMSNPDFSLGEVVTASGRAVSEHLEKKQKEGMLSDKELTNQAKDAVAYAKWKIRDRIKELSIEDYSKKIRKAEQEASTQNLKQDAKESTQVRQEAPEKGKEQEGELGDMPERTEQKEEGAFKKEELKKQAQLEQTVSELRKEKRDLKDEEGNIPPESQQKAEELDKQISEAQEKAQRGDTYGQNTIPIKDKKGKTLRGQQADRAAREIEGAIQEGIDNNLSPQEVASNVKDNYQIENTEKFNQYISDRMSEDVPNIGNNKQSFPAWRKGKLDSELKEPRTGAAPKAQKTQQNQKKQQKPDKPKEKKKRTMRLVDFAKQQEKLSKAEEKGRKKGVREGERLDATRRRNLGEYISEKYKEYSADNNKEVPTYKAKQISNIMKNLNTKNLYRSLEKVDRVFDVLNEKGSAKEGINRVKKLRKKLKGTSGGKYGSAYRKLKDLTGMGDSKVKFSPSDVYQELSEETYEKYNDVIQRAVEGDVSGALANIPAKELSALHKEVMGTMREANKRKIEDAAYIDAIAEQISEEVQDIRVNNETIENTKEDLSEILDVDESLISEAYRKARDIQLQQDVLGKIRLANDQTQSIPDIEDAVIQYVAKNYDLDTADARKKINNTEAMRNLRKYGASLGSDFNVENTLKDYKEEIRGTISDITAEGFADAYREEIPNIDRLMEDLRDVLGEGGELTYETFKKAISGLGRLSDFNTLISALRSLRVGNVNIDIFNALNRVYGAQIMDESLAGNNNFLGLSKDRFKKQQQVIADKEYKGLENIYKRPVDWMASLGSFISDVAFSDKAIKAFKGQLLRQKIGILSKISPKGAQISTRLKLMGKFWQKWHPNFMVGEILNPYSRKGAAEFHENIYNQISSGMSVNESMSNKLAHDIKTKYAAVIENIDPKVVPENTNKEFFFEVLTTLHNLQLEIDSNPDIYGDKKVSAFVEATVQESKRQDTNFNMHTPEDIEVIQEIHDKFTDGDGRVQMDEIRDLSDARAADLLDFMTSYSNDVLLPMISHVAFTQTGEKFVPIKNRMHRNAFHGREEKISTPEEVKNRILGMGTTSGSKPMEAGSAKERINGIPAISFLGVNSFMKDANDVMYDYHISSAMRRVNDVLKQAKARMEDEYFIPHLSEERLQELREKSKDAYLLSDIDKVQDEIKSINKRIDEKNTQLKETSDKTKKRDLKLDIQKEKLRLDDVEYMYDMSIRLGLMQDVFDKTMYNELALSYVQTTGVEKWINNLIDQTSSTVLVRGERVASESLSNLTSVIALVTKRASFSQMTRASQVDLSDVMDFTGSPIQNRMGRVDFNDYGIKGVHQVSRARKSRSSGINKVDDFIDRNKVGQAKKVVSAASIRTPDRIFGRMLWNVNFLENFKKLTGENFNKEEFERSESYRKKHKKLINKAGARADQFVNLHFGASIRGDSFAPIGYSKLGSISSSTGDYRNGSVYRIWAKVQNKFRSFQAQDFATSVQAMRYLLDNRYTKNDQETVRADAARSLTAVVARQLAYQKMIAVLGTVSTGVVGAAINSSYEDDDEKNFFERTFSEENINDIGNDLKTQFTTSQLKKDGLFGIGLLPVSAMYNITGKAPFMFAADKLEELYNKEVLKRPYDYTSDIVYSNFNLEMLMSTASKAWQSGEEVVDAISQVNENARDGVEWYSEGAMAQLTKGATNVWDALFGIPAASLISDVDPRDFKPEERSKYYAAVSVQKDLKGKEEDLEIFDAWKKFSKELRDRGYNTPADISQKELDAFIELVEKGRDRGERFAEYQNRKDQIVARVNAGLDLQRNFIQDYVNSYLVRKAGQKMESVMLDKNTRDSLIKEISNNPEYENRANDIEKLGRSYAVLYNEDGDGLEVSSDDDVDTWAEYLKSAGNPWNPTVSQDAPTLIENNILDKMELLEEDLKGKLKREEIQQAKQIAWLQIVETFSYLAGDEANLGSKGKRLVNVELPTEINMEGVSKKQPQVGIIPPKLWEELMNTEGSVLIGIFEDIRNGDL